MSILQTILTLPCPALPCPALPCPALPCPALPCPALPCPALPCPQTRFLHARLSVWLAIPGRVNASNSRRCSGWSERTLRSGFHRPLPWLKLHLTLVQMLVQCGALDPRWVLAIDASFIPKSGSQTEGRGRSGMEVKDEPKRAWSCPVLR